MRPCAICGVPVALAQVNAYPRGWVNPSPVEVLCSDDLRARNLELVKAQRSCEA